MPSLNLTGTTKFTTSSNSSSPWTFSYDHTPARTDFRRDMLMIVLAGQLSSATTSVTFGGQSLTLIDEVDSLMDVSVWGLYSPTNTGSQTVSIAFTGTVWGAALCYTVDEAESPGYGSIGSGNHSYYSNGGGSTTTSISDDTILTTSKGLFISHFNSYSSTADITDVEYNGSASYPFTKLTDTSVPEGTSLNQRIEVWERNSTSLSGTTTIEATFTGGKATQSTYISNIFLELVEYPQVAPSVSIDNETNVFSAQFDISGNVSSEGSEVVTERGFVWSTSPNPTTADNKEAIAGTTGDMSTTITGLTAGTTYYVRAFATNSVGTVYSSNNTVKTPAFIPQVISTVNTGSIT